MQKRKYVPKIVITLPKIRTRTSEDASENAVHSVNLVNKRSSSTSNCGQEQLDSDRSNTLLDDLEDLSNNIDPDDSQMIGGTTDEFNHNQAMYDNEEEPAGRSDVTLQEEIEERARSILRNNSPEVIAIFYNHLLR